MLDPEIINKRASTEIRMKSENEIKRNTAHGKDH